MSRLYGTLSTESKKPRTLGASSQIEATINWGSAGNSMEAARVIVTWGKGESAPTVRIITGADIKEIILNGETQGGEERPSHCEFTEEAYPHVIECHEDYNLDLGYCRKHINVIESGVDHLTA